MKLNKAFITFKLSMLPVLLASKENEGNGSVSVQNNASASEKNNEDTTEKVTPVASSTEKQQNDERATLSSEGENVLPQTSNASVREEGSGDRAKNGVNSELERETSNQRDSVLGRNAGSEPGSSNGDPSGSQERGSNASKGEQSEKVATSVNNLNKTSSEKKDSKNSNEGAKSPSDSNNRTVSSISTEESSNISGRSNDSAQSINKSPVGSEKESSDKNKDSNAALKQAPPQDDDEPIKKPKSPSDKEVFKINFISKKKKCDWAYKSSF